MSNQHQWYVHLNIDNLYMSPYINVTLIQICVPFLNIMRVQNLKYKVTAVI